MRMKPKFVTLLFILSGLFASTAEAAGPQLEGNSALLYAVSESANVRGSISVYDIAAEHRLIKTIHTVPGVGDVRGVAASAVTGKLYVAYMDVSGAGMVYCLNIYNDTILWNSPGVDRLAINPDGQLLYVPTWEAARPTTSTSWTPIRARSFEKYISPIDRTTRSTRYPGRFSKRRKPTTAAAIICI